MADDGETPAYASARQRLLETGDVRGQDRGLQQSLEAAHIADRSELLLQAIVGADCEVEARGKHLQDRRRQPLCLAFDATFDATFYATFDATLLSSLRTALLANPPQIRCVYQQSFAHRFDHSLSHL